MDGSGRVSYEISSLGQVPPSGGVGPAGPVRFLERSCRLTTRLGGWTEHALTQKSRAGPTRLVRTD